MSVLFIRDQNNLVLKAEALCTALALLWNRVEISDGAAGDFIASLCTNKGYLPVSILADSTAF